MPRFTLLWEKSDSNLVYFDEVDNYAKHIIKPSKKVNKALIIKEWGNVLRIVASLVLKKTTQSQIVANLSSYKKTNPTLKALIAFDGIIMIQLFSGLYEQQGSAWTGTNLTIS